MILAVMVAVVSIAAGTALGLGARSSEGISPALRSFALVSAVAVVLAQLLPEALNQLGLVALLVFGGALVFPALAERAGRAIMRRARRDHGPHFEHRIALELGYLGLLVHQVGDGVALGAFADHGDHTHTDVAIAIAAHSVPVVAMIVLSFRTHSTMAVAIRRAVGLILATLAGIISVEVLPSESLGTAEPWITAAVGGLLLHVVMHDWRPSKHRDTKARLLDIIAVSAGLALILLGGHSHHGVDESVPIREKIGSSLIEFTLETAPSLLFGLFIGALLQTFGSKLPMGWLTRGSSFRQAWRGAMIGIPLPICACGVLPLAHSLRTRGAGPALVVSFLLATPELGVETFALTYQFLGLPFALVRLVAAVIASIVTALIVARFVRRADAVMEPTEESSASLVDEPRNANVFRRVLHNFDELLFHIGPWTVLGLLAAAVIEAVVPTDSLGALRSTGLDILVVSAIAIPSYVCASAATPMAAVLLAKGMSPGAVLAGLILGPATNVATIGYLRQTYGTRGALLGIGGVVVLVWAIGFGLNHSPIPIAVSDATETHEHGVLGYATMFILLGLMFRGIWRYGVRTWVASLGESLHVRTDGGHDHDHGHEHGHGHGHEHEHEHEHGHGHGHEHEHERRRPEG